MFLYIALSNHPSPKLNKCFFHSKQEFLQWGKLIAETSFELSLRVWTKGGRLSFESLLPTARFPL